MEAAYHSSIVLGLDDVVIWGGDQAGLPSVHDNEEEENSYITTGCA